MPASVYFTNNLIKISTKTATAADAHYQALATCDKDKHILSNPDPNATAYDGHLVFQYLKARDAGKTLEASFKWDSNIHIKKFSYVGAASGSNDHTGLFYKYTENGIDTFMRVKLANQSKEYQLSIVSTNGNVDGGSFSPEGQQLTSLGQYGKFIRFFNDSDTANEPRLNLIQVAVCKIFNEGNTIQATMSPGANTTTNAPTIIMPGNESEMGRPEMSFKLTHYIHTLGGALDNNVFYFTYDHTTSGSNAGKSEERWKNIAIKVFINGDARAVSFGDLTNYQDDSDARIGANNTGLYQLPSWAKVNIDKQAIFTNLINKVYNQKGVGENTCGNVVGPSAVKDSNWGLSDNVEIDCLNVSDTGYLAAWHVSGNDASYFKPSGSGDDVCGKVGGDSYISKVLLQAFCGLGMSLKAAADSLMSFAVNTLQESIGSNGYQVKVKK